MTAESTAAEIVLDHVTKRYGNSARPAIDDLSITIRAGEICVLIGPSGGGKTTAMKMINRLISITEGDITIDGTSVKSLDTTELRRGIGYVIQQIGLFPHMTVEDNIAHGAAAARLGQAADPRARARELLELVGLDPDEHAKRYPSQLSGGQRQRVGLARAMAADPPLMLMDEPFGAIDPITRERLQNDFLRLHREIRKTVVFVTHDIDEAIKMGDRICHPARGRRARPVRHAGSDPRRARRRVRGPVRRRRPRPQAARAAPAGRDQPAPGPERRQRPSADAEQDHAARRAVADAHRGQHRRRRRRGERSADGLPDVRRDQPPAR